MADYTSEIQKLYVEYFGRPADPNGLAFWVNGMNVDPNVITQIRTDFATSAEYQSQYAGKSNHDIINTIYHNVFGREGDAAGLQFWTNALDTHSISIENAVVEIVKGAYTAQNSDAVVFNARLAVAISYTQHLDTPAEVSAYMGANAFATAAGLIGSITDLLSAANAINPSTIDANIAQIVGSAQSTDATHYLT